MKRLPILLALAPLLGTTDLLIKAATVGLIGLLTLLTCGLVLAPLHDRVKNAPLMLTSLLVAALCIGSTQLLLQIISAELADALGLFMPLLALPCLALPLQDEPKFRAGLRSGLQLLGLAMLLGTLRELFGHGSLLAHAGWLFGSAFSGWQLFGGLPLLTQAAGTFILLGLLLALFRHFKPEKA
jgi:electron transport complex protein RnfE